MQLFGPRLAILLVLTAAPWGMARADIFRCLAPDGKTLYSDAPCPRGVVRSSNITTAIGACANLECTAQREQAAGYARARLRSEQEQLASLSEKRRRDELDAARERARLDDLIWRQSVEARLASAADEPAYAAGYAPYYPFYSGYPTVKPCGRHCADLHPRRQRAMSAKHPWGTSLRLDRR